MTLADYFLANDEEIARTFAGWVPSPPLLAEPYLRRLRNPFTKEEYEVLTRVPMEQPQAPETAADDPDYQKLEWFDMKGVDWLTLAELGQLLMGWSEQEATDEIMGRLLHGPAESHATVFQVPPSMIVRIAALTDAEVESLGAKWSASIQEADAWRWDKIDWIDVLRDLRGMAEKATLGNRNLYLRESA